MITEGWHAFGVLGEDTEPEVLEVENCRWPEPEVSHDGYFGIHLNAYGDDTSTAFCAVLAISQEKAVAKWRTVARAWSCDPHHEGGNLRQLLWEHAP